MRSTNPASTSRSEGLGSIFMKRTGGNPVDFCRLKDRPPIDSQRAFDTLHHKIAATAASDSMKRPRTMTSAHSLQGLMKWLTRAEWRDRFAEVYDHHRCRPPSSSHAQTGRAFNLLRGARAAMRAWVIFRK